MHKLGERLNGITVGKVNLQSHHYSVGKSAGSQGSELPYIQGFLVCVHYDSTTLLQPTSLRSVDDGGYMFVKAQQYITACTKTTEHICMIVAILH